VITIVLLLLVLALAAGLAALRLPAGAAAATSAVTGIACFGLVLSLIPHISRTSLSALGFVRVDALSVVFLLATSFLYGCVSVYSIGYLRTAGGRGPGDVRYARRFWARPEPLRLVDAGRADDEQPRAALDRR
jgi:hydrogenase-4 component F